jgi:penicillin-binding protein 2
LASDARPGRFLPGDPRVEEPYRLTPQTMLRAGVLGAVMLTIFALLFLRLWSLQVLNSKEYLRTAQANQQRLVMVPAPRGDIRDRFGRVLVTNRPSVAIEIWPADLPKQRRAQNYLLAKVAKLTGTPLYGPDGMRREIDQRVGHGDVLTPVIVKQDVNKYLQQYLTERATHYPGVQLAKVFARTYPRGAAAAHMLGYVSEVTPEELKANKALHPGDIAGQAGVEHAFDDLLRGKAGDNLQKVNSLGHPQGHQRPDRLPVPGYDVRLTVDLKLQQAAEDALLLGIQTAHANKEYYANGGAIVALDPRDGSVRALASYPSYDPSVFTGRVTTKKLLKAGLLDPAASAMNNPSIDRATAGIYAPGSTFKPMTAVAAMEAGQLSPGELLNCPGSYTVKGQTFHNWDPYSSGAIDLATALSISCDTYFYQVGYRIYGLGQNHGHPIQDWASHFGFGKPTGFDLGGEASGLLPTPEWREKTYTKATDPNWQIDRLWKPGDSIQLAIGQKDLLVTPLQMARFYAALANGGKLVTPHVFDYAQQPSGEPVSATQHVSPAAQQLQLQPGILDSIRAGLYKATHDSTGTSSAIFSAFPVPIAGKTGTAEQVVNGVLRNQSWWCGFGPVDKPSLVVCALIENGGHGGVSAAPAARHVFEEFFHATGQTVGPVKSD